MFKKFYPSVYYKSTYAVNFQEYYEKGFRGIIFDIDNTLVPHGADADERAVRLFQTLKNIGFDTCLTSNNKEERVQRFNKDIHSHYIYKANKPAKSGYQKAMRLMGTNEKNTMFVGDQLFTDVFGANRVGLYSILVAPMHPKEEIQIVLKRYLEKIVLFVGRNKIDKRF
ncbi:MAG: YqeG family HAD IIIA-type phosphatase [Lachnospiraceae bacterium]|nr:YqeG family HAD IIIA-type phosphatase [Lachnospiraceae bacterium]